MTPIMIELGWRGIFPTAGYHRQTCPQCSPYRAKADQKCLVVEIISDTEADVICHHCSPTRERIAA
jgi:hypothetical protein